MSPASDPEQVTIPKQAWESILEQLSNVTKKNEELSGKVAEMKATIDRITDKEANKDLLKCQPRHATGNHAPAKQGSPSGSGTVPGHQLAATKHEDLKAPSRSSIKPESKHGISARLGSPSGIRASDRIRKPPRRIPEILTEAPKNGIKKRERETLSPCASREDEAPEQPAKKKLNTGVAMLSLQGSPKSKLEVKPRGEVPPDKIEEGALNLKKETVHQYLEGVPSHVIQSPSELCLSRHMLNKSYRCITQGLLWEKGPHKFLFPTYNVNPLMPTAPGEPGLMLSARTETTRDTWTLFIKLINHSKARWNYAGEYRGETVGALTPEEFAEQPIEVKRTWGEKIAYSKGIKPYVAMRARITLRKLGKELNDEELRLAVEDISKTPKASSKISIYDAIQAFESGEESIPIVRMTCVGYRTDFANELAHKLRVFERGSADDSTTGKRKRTSN
ncbi:hypothetical protein FA15DRAFT_672077 [Coprinopsis marcescibilis]|uniref:DUF6697 domain-containing protein n=1 Tax=Coprinopsis marcescibilis TaxID=230819 RepID=A0A5C3KPG6_COPMA|nr:hypothetical protein FA15DRAFT_672077 [Coprinopsis marcescibilis]